MSLGGYLLNMRIVQLITRSDNIGGAQVHVRDLSVELKKLGIKVYILVGGNGTFIDEMKKYNMPVYPVPSLIRSINPYFDFRAFFEIRNLLKRLQPDLVATHSSKAGILGRLAAYSQNIPVVFTAHGWAFTEGVSVVKQKIYLLVEKTIGRITSKIITVSGYDQKLSLKHKVIPLHKLMMIHNGIPEIPMHKTSQNVAIPKFIMTARLEKPKNHIFLLQALALLKDYKWKIDFIGEGPLRSKIEQSISQLELKDRVRLLGERKDVVQQLKESQGFILVSDWEGLPISILEAMRAGLPVIASDIGGIPEMIDDHVNGFLIPKGDKEQLINKLSILFCNRDLRIKMGMASREKYENQFKISKMVEQTLAIYIELITSRLLNVKEVSNDESDKNKNHQPIKNGT